MIGDILCSPAAGDFTGAEVPPGMQRLRYTFGVKTSSDQSSFANASMPLILEQQRPCSMSSIEMGARHDYQHTYQRAWCRSGSRRFFNGSLVYMKRSGSAHLMYMRLDEIYIFPASASPLLPHKVSSTAFHSFSRPSLFSRSPQSFIQTHRQACPKPSKCSPPSSQPSRWLLPHSPPLRPACLSTSGP